MLDSSDYDADGKNLIQNCRNRLLEMFKEVKSLGSSRKVLIMDEFTVKMVSKSFKKDEVIEQHICDFYNLKQIRQPMHSLDAIYFIRPTENNVALFLRDMATNPSMYKNSPLSAELKTHIRSHSILKGRLRMLELNLEYLVIDSLGFVTNNELALVELFEDVEADKFKGVACLDEMATRIATLFVSLKEYPVVRYRATKSLSTTTVTSSHDLIPTKLAARVLDRLIKYKDTNPNYPPHEETCELLILDRTIDQISPVIHEWTYDAMCHDLLCLSSKKEDGKLVFPADDDSLWLELRHAHIADVYLKLHEKVEHCTRSPLLQVASGSRGDIEIPASKLASLVVALPNYIEQKQQLDLHVEIAAEIDELVKKLGLQELGQLEQDLVVGNAGVKDVEKYFCSKDDSTREHKLRLLMILASIYPEAFEGEKGHELTKLAALHPSDMNAVNNVMLLGGFSDSPKSMISKFLSKYGFREKRAVRRNTYFTKEETWQLSNFYPYIEELVEKISKAELSNEDYPCINGSSPISYRSVSRRTRQPPKWAQRQANNNIYPRCANGPSIIIFIVGGATRSELRVCHKLTAKLKRKVILGSSSLDNPAEYITKMKLLNGHEDFSITSHI